MPPTSDSAASAKGPHPRTIILAWYWLREHYAQFADDVYGRVIPAALRGAYEVWSEHAIFKDHVIEQGERLSRCEEDPWSRRMLYGPWVNDELYAAFWERLRRVRRAAAWDRHAPCLRVAELHYVLYRTFLRCAEVRTCDYLNLPIPREQPLQLLAPGRDTILLDVGDASPVRTYGPMPS
jgi:hypothetical protein